MHRLARPLTPVQQFLAVFALLTAVSSYCLVYAALSGGPASLGEALRWTVVNVLPWAVAFEAGKRSGSILTKGIAITTALAASLTLGLVIGTNASLDFEFVRRIPGLLATLVLLGLARPASANSAQTPNATDLPLLPSQIEWIAAAGNYVELHASGRTVIHRAPLGKVFAELSGHGFVQIHRSIVVRRDQISRLRPLDVVLRDGTSLKIGKRYRAALEDYFLLSSSLSARSNSRAARERLEPPIQ